MRRSERYAVLTARTRSGQTFTATYDGLNRPMAVTAPPPIVGQAPTDSVAYTKLH